MSIISRISDNKGSFGALMALILLGYIMYIRVIRDNAIYEEFNCKKNEGYMNVANQTASNLNCDCDKKIISNEKLNNSMMKRLIPSLAKPSCSIYTINDPPIASRHYIKDTCHTGCSNEQNCWDCINKYEIENTFLQTPEDLKNSFPKNYPIFYKV